MKRPAASLAAAFLLLGSPAPAEDPAAAGLLVVDDFEDRDLESSSGLSWIVIADDQRGGLSTGALSVVPEGAGGSEAGLRFHGSIEEGLPYPFAGTWALVHEGGLPGDLAGYRGLRFYARAVRGTFQAGLRQSRGGRGASFMAPFEAGEEWRLIELPFSRLERYPAIGPPVELDPSAVVMLGISTMPGHRGEFELEIDQVELIP